MRFWPLLWTVLICPAPPQSRADIYVSPKGRDTWSGRTPAPNRRLSDGPFRTIERAQRAVRESHKLAKRPIRVYLRGGLYALDRPLVLTAEDSGQYGVVFAAYRGERPVISGGRTLTGFRQNQNGWWELNIAEAASGEWLFNQLFVNGERRYRPRLPKRGYFTIAETLTPSPKAEGKGIDRFKFAAGDIRADWHNLTDGEVLGFQVWTMARLRIQSVDASSSTVTFTGHTRGLEHYAALPKGNRYLVENVREALSEPGEFYLDRSSGALTYIPKPGERSESAQVIAPRLERLLTLDGAQKLEFRGITFAHTNWITPPEGNAFPQAEINLGAAVTATNSRDCSFVDCSVTHTGAYGVELGRGCKRVTIENCRITDTGAGGVKIGEIGIRKDENEVASHNTVRKCLIAHGGRIHPAAVGVWIGHSHHNLIEFNEIADLYYTGVSVGWSWGYGESLAHHNRVERNHIHDIGQGVLSDMGGIYTLGLSPGTVLRANRIHDVNAFGYGGWGIYPDEGSTGILIEDNVVFRTKSAGFHQHYGRENMIRNNIFAFGREAQLMRTRPEPHLSFTLEGNIIYWTEGPLLGSNWSGDQFRLDRNLYWNAAGKPVDFAGILLEKWREKGQDRSSLIADPLFRNSDADDFRLKSQSPAAQIGFRTSPASAPKKAEVKAPPAFPTSQ